MEKQGFQNLIASVLTLNFSERKGKLTKWKLTEDSKLEKVLDKDTGAILDMKFDEGKRFRIYL